MIESSVHKRSLRFRARVCAP